MPGNQSKKAVALREKQAELMGNAAKTGRLDELKELVKNGANVNKTANLYYYHDIYPLEYAAQNGHADCMRYLLDNGAKLNPRRKRGQKVLLYAAASGNPECLQVLFDKGMDVNEKGEFDETATMWAAEYNKPECMKILLLHNPDLNMETSKYDAKTVLYIAAECNSIECVRLLLNYKPKPNIDSNRSFSYCRTPLCIASYEGHSDIVKLLLENGANVNEGEYGFSPLRLAVEKNKLGCVQVLCDNGADMNVPEGEDSLLLTATRNTQCFTLETLLYRGCDPNQKSGKSPEMYPIDLVLQKLINETWSRMYRSRALKILFKYGAHLDMCKLAKVTSDLFYGNDLRQVEMYCVAIETSCTPCAQSLYEKAIEIFEKEPDKLKQVNFHFEKATSLENQASRYIRKCVNSSGVFLQAHNFQTKVDSLPLPEEVKKHILLEHLEPLIDASY
ncbi:unnamed protein product [Owenia fusiformis]|uniref:Uncharacterized protein n=1 Tax=Owenia fusiformis TaxID=6347 RepID=A0A8S4PC90_OWEFU|nr:unnamed protein product [Owenia fusiformis]